MLKMVDEFEKADGIYEFFVVSPSSGVQDVKIFGVMRCVTPGKRRLIPGVKCGVLNSEFHHWI